MTTVSERLQSARGDKSRRSFAEMLGIPPSTLKNYEQGDTSPTIETLEVVCEKLCISRRWLILGEGSMKQEDSEDGLAAQTGACPHCLELFAKLDEARKETIATLKDKSLLQNEVNRLSKELEALKNERNSTTDNEEPMASAS